MPSAVFDKYINEINKAYLRGDSTEHTHRPALKALIEALAKKITSTNEPRRTECGAPDFIVSRRERGNDQIIGYIECKDIGTDLKQVAKIEQIKKRYLPSLHNLILTDYIEFWWYVNEEKRLTAKLAEEKKGKFRIIKKGQKDLDVLFDCFFAQEPQKITTAKELATKMAHKAQMMRDVIVKAFEQEQETGPLHGQFEGFKDVLLHDLSEKKFADMYAQTISYGLFTARCNIDEMTLYGEDKHAVFHGMNGKTGELTREHAAFMLPKTNPFLRSIFSHITGLDLDDRVSWLVDDLIELLHQADMGQVLRDFAKKKGRRDPVVHFYETFLSEYDPKMRKQRGVYYTPDEVVSYIVQSLDCLLKKKFGVKRGLADESKVKIKDRDGRRRDVHKVLILDPAVGTGTFLFEVIDLIYSRFKKQQGMWSGYVREHLLPRIFGFEIQMAPYAICHMKLGLELAETGYDFQSDERLGIYLTNTLEEAEEISKNIFVRWLSDEARAANKVKKEYPVMIVTGNPPYLGHSENKGPWITGLIEDYKRIQGKKIRLGQSKWLQNDYVKFIRYAQYRIMQTGYGVVAMITDHSYIDSGTFVAMRAALQEAFDEIYVLDLHGNAKKNRNRPDLDQNIFEITEGVAIVLAVRYSENSKPGRVFVSEIRGTRKYKENFLSSHCVDSTEWEEAVCKEPYYLFVSSERSGLDKYNPLRSIVEILPGEYKSEKVKRVGTGFVTTQDSFAISFTDSEQQDKISRFLETTNEQEARSVFQMCSQDQWNYEKAKNELKNENWKKDIRKVVYRPFDFRFTVWNSNVCVHRRLAVHKHLVRGNRILCVGQAGNVIGSDEWALVYCAYVPVDFNIFYRGGCALLPLYLYPIDGQTDMDYEKWPRGKDGRVPNLDRGFVEELAERIELEFLSDGQGDLNETFGPEDVLEYIYAVLHSKEYRQRYAEFLKIDFPRIPWPKNREIFVHVSGVGKRLMALHLMDAEVLDEDAKWPTFAKEGDNIVENGYPKYVAKSQELQKAKVFINKDQYFEGVQPYIWEFHIGGYQVCERWLKYRRGLQLSYDDIRHYQKIVVALGETIRLMNERCLSEMFE